MKSKYCENTLFNTTYIDLRIFRCMKPTVFLNFWQHNSKQHHQKYFLNFLTILTALHALHLKYFEVLSEKRTLLVNCYLFSNNALAAGAAPTLAVKNNSDAVAEAGLSLSSISNFTVKLFFFLSDSIIHRLQDGCGGRMISIGSRRRTAFSE